MITRPAALLAFFALAACAAPPAGAPIPIETAGWTVQTSATAGTALVHAPGDGGEDLRIACRRGPAQLWVQAVRFTHVGTEERLSLGVGSTVNALVATAGELGGVEATGPIFPDFLAALEAGAGPIGVSYGAQTLSLPAPEPTAARAFAAACRRT